MKRKKIDNNQEIKENYYLQNQIDREAISEFYKDLGFGSDAAESVFEKMNESTRKECTKGFKYVTKNYIEMETRLRAISNITRSRYKR